jgi:hypothetical protein
MADLDCPIWGTPATETRDSDGDVIHVFSHRAGGIYSISGTAVEVLKRMPIKDKLLLTTWLCEQRVLGSTDPLITTSILKDIKTKRPLLVSHRIRNALLFFNGLRLGDSVIVFDGDFSNDEPSAGVLAALTECQDKDELLELLSLMNEMGLLADRTEVVGKHEYSPTAKGWMRIEELMLHAPDKEQAFVAMWFNPVTDSAYNDGIAQAIFNRGYKPLRIDNKEHANKIDDEIIAEIRRSRFVIADFTCEKEKGTRRCLLRSWFCRWVIHSRYLDMSQGFI